MSDEATVMVSVQQAFRVNHDVTSTIHERAEAVMAELVDLGEQGGLLDSAVDVDAELNTVHVQVTVEADDLSDGVAKAMAATRSAIHAVGDSTPGWPSHKVIMELIAEKMSAELVEMS